MSRPDDEARAIIEEEMVRLQEELRGYQWPVPSPEKLAAAAARGEIGPNPAVVKMISDAVAMRRKQKRDAAERPTTPS